MSGNEISEVAIEAGKRHVDAVMHLLRPEHGQLTGEQPWPTLLELAARLGHIKASQDEWRVTVAYLAAQLHTARKISDADRAHDAHFALSQIRTQLDWIAERDEQRERVRAEAVASEAAPVDPRGLF